MRKRGIIIAIIRKSAPWVTYYREVDALFKKDKEVLVVFDEENIELKIYVDNQEKASAIRYLMPNEKEFGDVILKIKVIPSNGKQLRDVGTTNIVDIASDAFRCNNAVCAITDVRAAFDLVYVIFKKEVVQYFDDNLGDINGNCSTLYEVIARDVLNDVGIKYCTDCGKDNRSAWEF